MDHSQSSKLELALLGGTPTFSSIVHVGRPNIGNRERFLERINGMLDRRWLTNHGPLVEEFEQRIAEHVGVKHVICVCNATIGLEIAIRAADLNGEVIVPSYTFIATAHALQWQEITPIFADLDSATHTLDPARIERHITPRTTGIIGTHLWGRACDVDAIQEIAQRRGLAVLFDAAHAFDCTSRGRMIGGFGLAEVFSFHATKFLNSFEGGAICTNDDALAHRIRLMTNFGFEGYDKVIHVGTNGKMTEASAAMGLTNLECMEDFIGVNKRNHAAYAEQLAGLPGIRLKTYDPLERNCHQYVVVEVDAATAGLTRDEIMRVLHAENVLARRYFWPGVHRMEPYKSLFPHAHLLLPDTERIAARVIVLPTGTSLAVEDVGTICGILRQAIHQAGEVRAAIQHLGA